MEPQPEALSWKTETRKVSELKPHPKNPRSISTEAFEKLKEAKPDLILLDLILPGMHGFQILQQLKKDSKTKPIPVIILTNLGQRDEVEQGINLGAEDFLIKAHHTIEEIIDKVREVLRRQKK